MIKQDILENLVKTAYIGIGSNLGNKRLNIEKAKAQLQFYNINILKCSHSYETESWPNRKNPKFINVVIKIKTVLTPLDLLEICNKIEINLGRKRSTKNDPRTCDIDIIDYDQKVLNIPSKGLILPHRAMENRNFVLLPLFDINKCWKHPKTKIKIVKLINSLAIKDLRSIKQI